MAETAPSSASQSERRSHFLVPGNWAVFPRLRRPPDRQGRTTLRPAYTPLRQERPSWTGGVVAFMQKGREIFDILERSRRQRQQRERKLAELAAKQTVKKVKSIF
jgi:hypothetical protein